MKCPFCQNTESKVLDSRSAEETNAIRRRRECLNCGKRFTTYETVESIPILVIKRNQSRQPFDKEKIKHGLIKACEKRPVGLAQIDAICEEIEKDLQNSLRAEIPAQEIGELVMKKLKDLDEVAYVRFASVYRRFTDVTNFINFLNDL
jgi:transcriptional repressor NrdR